MGEDHVKNKMGKMLIQSWGSKKKPICIFITCSCLATQVDLSIRFTNVDITHLSFQTMSTKS